MRDRVNQPLGDVPLVVDGKLYGNLGPLGQSRRRAGDIGAVLEIRVHQPVSVQAVRGQNYQHDEVWEDYGEIEGVQVVKPAEGIPARVGKLRPEMRERNLRSRCCKTHNMLRQDQDQVSPTR